MSNFFISYRRMDSLAWAGRLSADLSRRFGSSQVFMDIDGIRRGANFEQVLKDKLSSCDVLLALIGPEWVQCKRSDGRQRLDVSDDWVRTEIVTALHRDIPVIPVLFGDTKCPAEDELPEDLHPLCKHQAATVSDSRWGYDLRELYKDLVRLTSNKALGQPDIAPAINGLLILRDWMSEPAVADSVSRSKEVIERTYRQSSKLKLFKAIHDALHTIESNCLRPIQAGRSSDPLRPYKISFTIQVRQIQEAMRHHDMDSLLREEIEDQITMASNAFKAALDMPGDTTQKERLVGELNRLLSSFPERLNSEIVRAADELDLARIVKLMTKVKNMLPGFASDQDSPFKQFIQGIEALQGLRDELKLRVDEHSRLQYLDRELRRGCVGGMAARTLNDDWQRIMRVRARFAPPFTSELELVYDDLTETESEVEDAIEKGHDPAAQAKIEEYFRSVGSVFLAVDTNLKDFCMRLSEVSQPLKTILDMC